MNILDPGAPRPEPFRLLFVCTGNTCRSPMAEALARREIEVRGWKHVEVGSAGIHAHPGAPASDGSFRVAAGHGLDLSGHTSSPLTPDLLAWADLILTMSPGHLEAVRSLGGGERATLLGSLASGDQESTGMGAVPDPFGSDDDVYEETYRVLHEMVSRVLDRLEPIVAP